MASTGETSAVAKFVSQKINKIRWKPSPGQVFQKSSTFACGTWDDPNNSVSIWTTEEPASSLEMDEDELYQPHGEPSCLCRAPHTGSVTDMTFLPQDLLLVSSSRGSVQLYKHHVNSQTLSIAASWPCLHHHGDSTGVCTSVAVRGRSDDVFASVGEDGRIHLVSLDRSRQISTIENGDSCSINSTTFLKHNELATVNSSGQLKVWDLRQQALSTSQPARTFLSSTSEHIALHCIDKHPTQPHLVATGGEDGSLCLWDMRRETFPVTMLSAHSSHLWEVHFHPSYPNNLFTCSDDGCVWHWDANKLDSAATMVPHAEPPTRDDPYSASRMASSLSKSQAASTTPWLSCDAGKNKLDITDLLGGNTLPVNSIHITDNTLLCANDAEQVIVIQNLMVV